MSEFSLDELARLLSNNLEKREIIHHILFDDIEVRRAEICLLLGKNRMNKYNDLLIEVLLSDESPVVRSASFWSLSLLGNNEVTEVLLEAMEMEESVDCKLSMIDIFLIFAERIGLTAEQIQFDPQMQTYPDNTLMEQYFNNPIHQDDAIQIPESEIIDVMTDNKPDNQSDNKSTTIIEAKNRIKRLLFEITENIPMTLSRMAQLTNVTENSLERYLIELTSLNPTAGEYYQLEQIFIKKTTTIQTIIDKKPKPSIYCYSCGTLDSVFPCTSCGEGLQCITCRLVIGKDEDTLQCQSCLLFSHKSHLLEWIKIKGSCPNCHNNLKQKDFH
ncbi:MAG: HEAT repeat domain-containing protein [Candidatus Heimdallarchaeota archaeon]|nr:HEAT repeat domain-containing protein [Candidatus Heimdallarchaeota archaeon]MDH5645285.1 HEAT repeat domain-containing protein [Candidatus Heimdallarchaeota archaeon]